MWRSLLACVLLCGCANRQARPASPERAEERERAAWERVPVVQREPDAFDGGDAWMLVSGDEAAYRGGIVSSEYVGRLSAHVRSDQRPPRSELFGTMVNKVDASPYRGKRVRLVAEVKSEEIGGRIRQGGSSTRGWGGLSMRIDAEGGRVAAFTTSAMEGSAMRGTDAREESVELDVPEDATVIAYGLILAGIGWLEATDLRLEIVG